MVGRVEPQSSELQVSKVHIGTSGWTYDGWRGPFYPPDIPKREWLAFYAGAFSTTEINGSFYRTPSLEAVAAWRDQTPDDFLFAWKASKFITHWKRLTEKCENSIELMETRLRVLRAKAGPVLFQLPARFTVNRERLASFLRMLPNRYTYAFEFRHQSWYDDAIFDLLRENDVSLCLSDHHDAPAPWTHNGTPRLCAWPRTRWPLPRQLPRRDAAGLGAPHQDVGTAASRGVCVFR